MSTKYLKITEQQRQHRSMIITLFLYQLLEIEGGRTTVVQNIIGGGSSHFDGNERKFVNISPSSIVKLNYSMFVYASESVPLQVAGKC